MMFNKKNSIIIITIIIDTVIKGICLNLSKIYVLVNSYGHRTYGLIDKTLGPKFLNDKCS